MKRGMILFGLLMLLTACAQLRPDFEEPVVTVTSFRALPSENIVPRFEIGLHVVNPNNFPLELQGISYNIVLEGYRILTGVSKQLPRVEAYGEGDVKLQASPDLFSSLGLFTDLMQLPRETFSYELNAKLDVGSLLPKIKISKTGEVKLFVRNK